MGQPYLFEPEYTDQELREMEDTRHTNYRTTVGRQRVQETWWYYSRRCEETDCQTEVSVCCNEWAIGMPPLEAVETAGERTERSCVNSKCTLPCINWRLRPRPEGPGGTSPVE